MAKWDVTTAEGRIALERHLMKRIGYIEEDPKKPWAGWFIVQTLDEHRDYLPAYVELGWVFTPEGMVALKRWAAEKNSIVICSQVNEGGRSAYAEAYWSDEFGSDHAMVEADDEPTAVALALARALEEMER